MKTKVPSNLIKMIFSCHSKILILLGAVGGCAKLIYCVFMRKTVPLSANLFLYNLTEVFFNDTEKDVVNARCLK